eukprot:scpid79768/ scgid34433/ 
MKTFSVTISHVVAILCLHTSMLYITSSSARDSDTSSVLIEILRQQLEDAGHEPSPQQIKLLRHHVRSSSGSMSSMSSMSGPAQPPAQPQPQQPATQAPAPPAATQPPAQPPAQSPAQPPAQPQPTQAAPPSQAPPAQPQPPPAPPAAPAAPPGGGSISISESDSDADSLSAESRNDAAAAAIQIPPGVSSSLSLDTDDEPELMLTSQLLRNLELRAVEYYLQHNPEFQGIRNSRLASTAATAQAWSVGHIMGALLAAMCAIYVHLPVSSLL